MNREEFRTKTVEKLQRQFPNKDIKVDFFKTSHGNYEGVVIPQESGISPVINLDLFYDRYLEGTSYKNLFEEMLLILDTKPAFSDLKDKITDYDWVKQHLFFTVNNITQKQGIGRKVADLFLQIRIMVEDRDGIASCAIDNHLLDLWDVDEDTIIHDAFENAPSLMPVEIEDLANWAGEDSMKGKCLIVSTTKKIRGASALFYNGVAEQVHDLLGDFLALPSSVNEWICVADILPDYARKIVLDVNRSILNEEEWLSDEVYTFKDNTLTKIA